MQRQQRLVIADPFALQPRPAEGVFAFLDVLLGGAALVVAEQVVEAHQPVGIDRQVGNEPSD